MVLECWLLFLSIHSLATLGSQATASVGHDRTDDSTKTHLRRQLVASSRIVGGREAALGAHPGFVYWNQGCGGTLIASDIVLTAAQ